MAKGRVTSWVLIPVVFIVSVVGLFFTVTDPNSWPEESLQLSATDMRLTPVVSTVWCESLELSSDHTFIAYQVTDKPAIDPTSLAKHTVDIGIKLNHGRYNHLELKYFLLPGSIVSVLACASKSKAYVHIFKDSRAVKECLFYPKKSFDSSDFDSDEDSSDDEWDLDSSEEMKPTAISRNGKLSCPLALKSQEIPVSFTDAVTLSCQSLSEMHPLSFNATSADNYVIMITNTNHDGPNRVKLRLLLDRTTYSIQKDENSIHVCSAASTCTVPLSFASRERAMVWIPAEPDAGRNAFTVNYQCRPRVALFALLSVFLPIILFVIISFIIKVDKKRPQHQMYAPVASSNSNDNVTPLLVVQPTSGLVTDDHDYFDCNVTNRCDQNATTENSQRSISDSEPPPYETLYDLPPPYSCLKSAVKIQN